MSTLTSNPWAGLSSYQDPKYTDNPLKFSGREDDIYDLTRMVMKNIFVTLYGKSGIGKTSLLNAGVFPSLREAGFLPVSLRLNIETADCSFQKYIITRLENLVNEGAGNLQLLADKIDTTKMKKPSFLMVLTGVGNYAYKRPEDGVLVVPVGCLKD